MRFATLAFMNALLMFPAACERNAGTATETEASGTKHPTVDLAGSVAKVDPPEPQPSATPSGSAADSPPAPSASASASALQGTVLVGGAGVSGGAISNASSVVADMRGRFGRCYSTGLRSHPNMQGSVVITAKIGSDGKVQAVAGGGGSELAPIVGCLKAVVSGGVFAAPSGGGAVVSIPITFVKSKTG